MDANNIPSWLLSLEEEDVEFIRKFVLNSGSLKEIANIYDVSYPTVRIRLDKLIQKIQINEQSENEEFIGFIKKLSIEDQISLDAAKLIINKYKKERGDV